MSGTILFSAVYAEPSPVGSNRLVAAQAQALRQAGAEVEILTHPRDGYWKGPVPDGSRLLHGIPYDVVDRDGIRFHLLDFPPRWLTRVARPADWEEAVAWGQHLLRTWKPRVLHQHYWQSLRWMLEAAVREGVPNGYTFYDFGFGCLRTTLITGWGTICDGGVYMDRCPQCIRAGRNWLGKINEAVVRVGPIASVVDRWGVGPEEKGVVARHGGVAVSAETRAALTIERGRSVMSRANFAIVPSPFAGAFLSQFGLTAERTHVMPWPIDTIANLSPLPGFDGGLQLGYLGRIAPEKGVSVLLEAIERLPAAPRVTLRLAGNLQNEYAAALRTRYPQSAGGHKVIWDGVVLREQLGAWMASIHVCAFPSVWMDNTPASLVESLAYGRPCIVTDIPTMSCLVQHNVNGLALPMGDVEAWAAGINRLAREPETVASFALKVPPIDDARRYADRLLSVYDGATGKR